MEFLVGVALVALVWYIISLKKQNKALVAFAAIDRAEPWLEEQGINRDVTFASYVGRPYSLVDGAAVLVGQGKGADGSAVGFCVEVSDRMGFLGGIIVRPVGLTINHKQAAFYSRSTSTPIRTVLTSAMRTSGAARPKASEQVTPRAPEPVANQAGPEITASPSQDQRAREIEKLAALRRHVDQEAKRHGS